MSAEKSEKPAPEAAAAAPAEAAAKGGGAANFVPLILALVLAPAISWAVAQFVLLPKMKSELTAAVGAAGEPGGGHKPEHGGEAKKSEASKAEGHKAEAKKGEGKKAEGHGKKGEGGAKKGETKGARSEAAEEGYKFIDIVVNLSGTMGSRYLKTSFLVSGSEDLSERFEEHQAQLFDVTLNTLGSLSLADLEEVGSRNLIRARLIAAYNDVLGVRAAEKIYFSEFLVQ
jgi:flagellar FliL protein